MIEQMPVHEVPLWLREAAEDKRGEMPIQQILENSLYYPASGENGTPVKYLGGNVHSFLYADYGISVKCMLLNMYGTGKDCGFLGYSLVRHKDVFHGELYPEWWAPEFAPTQSELDKGFCDQTRMPWEVAAHWTVWRRLDDYPETHGPELFSFFFGCAEMSKFYQALYTRYQIKPLVLAVIQPGSFGGEWERTEAESSMFRRVISANPAGMPDYLLYGGFGPERCYNEPCWKAYMGERLVQLPERWAGLWRLAGE